MAELLQVPPGTRSEFKNAGDLLTWMENHTDPNDPQKRPYLSARRLDKLRQLLADQHVEAASALEIFDNHVPSGNQVTHTSMQYEKLAANHSLQQSTGLVPTVSKQGTHDEYRI